MKKNITKKLAKKTIIVLTILAIPSMVYAFQCPAAFDPYDREVVANRLALVTEMILNTSALANWSCLKNMTAGQREALESEYQYRMAHIESLDDGLPAHVKEKTKKFLNDIIDHQNLGTVGTSVLSKEAACAAMKPNRKASEKLRKCFQRRFLQGV